MSDSLSLAAFLQGHGGKSLAERLEEKDRRRTMRREVMRMEMSKDEPPMGDRIVPPEMSETPAMDTWLALWRGQLPTAWRALQQLHGYHPGQREREYWHDRRLRNVYPMEPMQSDVEKRVGLQRLLQEQK